VAGRLRGLAPRLIVALTLLVAVVDGIYGWISVVSQEQQLVGEVVNGADQLSRSIASATWHAMRADRRADAYEVMATIAKNPDVERIRIINKAGVVAFSTDGEAGVRVSKAAEECAVCHAAPKTLVVAGPPSRARILRGSDGPRRMGMVTAIYNEPACGTAGCHGTPEEQPMLGVLDVTLDLEHVDRRVEELEHAAVLRAVIRIVLLGGLIFVLTSQLVTKPLRALVAASRAVAEMRLDQPIQVSTTTELAQLERAFNVMRERLQSALLELSALTQNLEREVAARGERLLDAQERLIRSDRMATLGQLCASVAHEINNPLSGVLNLAMIVQRVLGDDGIPPHRIPEVRRYLQQISDETARAGRIVSDLLSFSRRSSPQRAPADLNQIVERAASLVAHKLSLAKVDARLDLAPGLPHVPCDRSQVEQVFLNLLMNSAESMPGGGTVTVRTRVAPDGAAALLDVEDTGSGIPKEVLARIYDPFFSTKEPGKGVGLGLTVVYGIVDAHGGTIDVESEVGRGTCFTVRLPLAPAETDPRAPRDGS
jgi:two-component system NtrC family sensor kinase